MGNVSSMRRLDKGKLTKRERTKRTKISTARGLIVSFFDLCIRNMNVPTALHWHVVYKG